MRLKKSLLALLMGGLGIGITEFVMMGLLEDIARDYRVSIPVAGYLISAYAMGVVVGAPLIVLFAARIPPKRLLILLMGMFTVFNGLSMFATGYSFLLVSRFLSGLPHGAFFGVGAVVASRLADPGKEARAVAVMFAGLTIANIGGVPLGTYIGHHISWRYTFALITLVGLCTMLALYVWMPALEARRRQSAASQLRSLLNPGSLLLVLTISIGTGGLFCWISYISPLMTRVAGFPEDSVSYILTLAGLGMFVGNLAGARLADRVAPAPAVIAMLILMACCLITVYFTAHIPAMALLMTFVTGAASFSLAAPIQILVIQTASGSEMLAASVSQAAFNVGNALGAYLGGLPIAWGLSYKAPEWVGVGMSLTGALIAWGFVRTHRATMAAAVPVEPEEVAEGV